MISDGRIPEDDRDNHLHPDHLNFTSDMAPQEAFSDLLETMTIMFFQSLESPRGRTTEPVVSNYY